MKRIVYTYILLTALDVSAYGQSTPTHEGLKQYVPVRPSVRVSFFKVDPKLGYAVKEVGGGAYGARLSLVDSSSSLRILFKAVPPSCRRPGRIP